MWNTKITRQKLFVNIISYENQIRIDVFKYNTRNLVSRKKEKIDILQDLYPL